MSPVVRSVARYEVLQRLGEGGMGVLYLARDPTIDRLVAIKLLHSHIARGELHERFLREARSAGALSHHNIVTVYDFGEHEDAPYIVMEYVRGETLAEIIKRRAQVPAARKLRWLEGMCAGLAYAHGSRIVHRDIKPQNLMVDERDTLKILDFGIARFAESGLTRASVQIGTPGYMSPEQVEGGAIDQRSDIFSAGAVAYELFAYREAFSGDTMAAILKRVLHDMPPPLGTVCRDVAPGLDEVVTRALQKDPAARFQDMEQLRRQLERVRVQFETREVDTRPMTPAPVIPEPGRVPPRPVTPRPRTEQANRARRRAEQIERHLSEARQALDAGREAEFEAACDAALLIDPDNEEALRLMDEMRQRIETAQAIEPLLAGAKLALSQGSLTSAEDLIQQASSLGASKDDLTPLREQVRRARSELDRLRRRDQNVKAALERARVCAADGAREAALRSVDEALALDPGNVEALELKASWATEPAPRGVLRPSPRPVHRKSAAPVVPPGPEPSVWTRPSTLGMGGAAVLIVGTLGYLLLAGGSADQPPRGTNGSSTPAGPTSATGTTTPPPPKTPVEPIPAPTAGPVASGGGQQQPTPPSTTEAGGAGTGGSSPPDTDQSDRRRQIDDALTRARLAEARSQYTDALQQFERVLRLDAGNVTALQGRDRVRTELANRVERARGLTRKGDQLIQVGEWDAAISELRQAVKLDGANAEARQLLSTAEKAKAAEEALRKRRQGS